MTTMTAATTATAGAREAVPAGTAAGAVSGAAFSDVDETLIHMKSMFRFLAFHLRRRGEPPATYERLADGLRAAARRGEPREQVNRRYYRLLAGEPVGLLERSGRSWFAHEQAQPGGPYVPEVARELRAHRAAGRSVVLLSGSFFACLQPVAEDIGADHALGSRPVVRRGLLTGEVLVPMIGAAKGRAVELSAALRGFDLAACSGYGDHSSDLPLLGAVGRPVAVGDDPELAAHARRHGWRRLASGGRA
ncbi:HAD family hydrolase [Streptomyces sp. NPDC090077]|uniref:HAD family hydrolase n=1 Tax=Streptomyces sp. NPDC090077 TaxID=3365938 RepID=UPI00380CFF5D